MNRYDKDTQFTIEQRPQQRPNDPRIDEMVPGNAEDPTGECDHPQSAHCQCASNELSHYPLDAEWPDDSYGIGRPQTILLSTGGPASRVAVDLEGDNHQLEVSNWGMPWTSINSQLSFDQHAALVDFVDYFEL